MHTRPTLALAGAALLALGLPVPPADARPSSGGKLDVQLDRAFRSDVKTIDVRFDVQPRNGVVRGRATVRFRMRPGQARPSFHFNPLRARRGPERGLLRSLRLDGERLDPRDRADVRVVRPAPGAELALELQRDLSPGEPHTLRARWRAPNRGPQHGRGWFVTDFDDTIGPRRESETFWPTVSSPEEQARHRIKVRVHGGKRYTVLGSGRAKRTGNRRTGTWTIDTRRPVASHTVLVAAVPAAQTRPVSFRVRGVRVRIVSDRPYRVIRRARENAERAIRRLVRDLGPFPMPRMEILLTGWGSGMEYYGATRTGLGSLAHELGHMYFGTSMVNRTWRDTWLDEAAVEWWQRHGRLRPLPPSFRSKIAAGRRAAAPGFKLAAYGAGARLLENIARAMGGDRAMMSFMARLRKRRAFKPVTTDDFIDDVLAAQDRIKRPRFERWFYGSR